MNDTNQLIFLQIMSQQIGKFQRKIKKIKFKTNYILTNRFDKNHQNHQHKRYQK